MRHSVGALAVCFLCACCSGYVGAESILKQSEDIGLPFQRVQKKWISPEAAVRGRAIAEKIWQADDSLGLSHEEWVKVCLFIERVKKVSPKKRVFPKSATGLPCKICFEPKLKGYLISELPHGYLDSGWHKSVSKVVLYGDQPKIIAACYGKKKAMAEVKILKKLRSGRGMAAFLGSAVRPHNKLEIWLEFYPDGSLLRKRIQRYQFSSSQLIKIFKDVAYGLQLMHKHHLVHRDLHFGNMLLRKGANGLFDAALIDYGQSSSPSAAGTKVPQVPGEKNPPEMLIRSVRKINRYAADVYALGVNFYALFWKGDIPWAHLSNPREMGGASRAERKRNYQQVVEKYEALKSECSRLSSNGHVLTPHERTQLVILKMLDYNPARRPKIREVIRSLEQISFDQ